MDHLASHSEGNFVNLQNHFDLIAGLEWELRMDAASRETKVRDSAPFRAAIARQPDIGVAGANKARKNRDGKAGGLRCNAGNTGRVWRWLARDLYLYPDLGLHLHLCDLP
jgi:hypothetical protein